MTIYATPFRASDKKPTAISYPSGFESIADVVAAMGPPDIHHSERMAIYGAGPERVVFSALAFAIDASDTTGIVSGGTVSELRQ